MGLDWYDYGARNYDASLGRWLNVDPLAEKTMTPYAYVNNNPVMLVNPDGRMAVPPTYFVNANTGEVKYVNDGINQVVVVSKNNWNWTNMYDAHVAWGWAGGGDFGLYNSLVEGEIHSANSYGMVELPSDGNPRNGQYTFKGEILYKVHNRNDMSFSGKIEQDQWGTPENIAKFMSLGIKFKNKYNTILSFGDLSTETGNSPRYNIKGDRHKTHFDGTQADLKYPTTSGGLTNSDREASVERTQFIIDFAKENGFGHRIIGTGIAPKIEGESGSNKSHNNHIHIGK